MGNRVPAVPASSAVRSVLTDPMASATVPSDVRKSEPKPVRRWRLWAPATPRAGRGASRGAPVRNVHVPTDLLAPVKALGHAIAPMQPARCSSMG